MTSMSRYSLSMLVCIMVLFLLGCSNDEPAQVKMYSCPDGRLVTEPSACEKTYQEPELSHTEEDDVRLNELEDTPVVVKDESDAKQAFTEYVDQEGLDYDFVSAEFFERRGGIDIYKVVYRHHELTGGKRQVFIGSDGKVYEQEMRI